MEIKKKKERNKVAQHFFLLLTLFTSTLRLKEENNYDISTVAQS